MNNNDIRTQKEETRRLASSFSTRRRALFMPSSEMYCVKKAEDEGMISPGRTDLVLVERDKYKIHRLKQNLRQTGWENSSYLFPMELDEVDIPFDLDYAWLDLYGNIPENVAYWMARELSPNLQQGAILCLTTQTAFRSNEWLKAMRERTKGDFREAYIRFRYENSAFMGDAKGSFTAFLVACLCRQWRLGLRHLKYYNDTVEMAFYCFEVLHEIEPVLPSLFEISEGIDMATKKGSQAALKAWATRRNQPVTARQVIESVLAGSRNVYSLWTKYVLDRMSETGSDPVHIQAALKAHVTRKSDEDFSKVYRKCEISVANSI